jgi:hypothetical protein
VVIIMVMCPYVATVVNHSAHVCSQSVLYLKI